LLGGFNGWEVARAARELDPSFPVVYMTGAAADQWAIRAAMASAHQAAVVSGHKRSIVRFWKRKGDEIFTAEEAAARR
jgi:CheY-like chemotaxis protein